MKVLQALFGKRSADPVVTAIAEAAPTQVVSPGAASAFDLDRNLWGHEGLPILNWQAVEEWSQTISDPNERLVAKARCQRGWLLHFRDVLGAPYELHESEHCFLLAPYSGRTALATLRFVAQTRARILEALDGLAKSAVNLREILIIFADQDAYYTYVSHAYPEEGEFAFSGGMLLHADCPHFVTTHEEVSTVERVIAHEMTHASLAHLPIPLWLNEGIAVNTEDRLMGRLPKLYSPAEMQRKHAEFWNATTIQEFWSGKSFHRTDDGNLLSYDLARILVEIFAADWSSFRSFANAANYTDAGDAAAREHLGISLGDSLASIFEQSSSEGWHPSPASWHDDIDRDPA